MHSTSASLLRKIRESADQHAWTRFVALYQPLLSHWAQALVPEADVPDFVQDIFVILFRELPTFDYDPSRSFRGWLRTIVTNEYYGRGRKRPVDKPSMAVEEQPDSDPALKIDKDEYNRYLVDRALAIIKTDFDRKTWQAFLMRAQEDRPAKEVGQELGLTEQAVWLACFRVRKRVKDELEGLMEH